LRADLPTYHLTDAASGNNNLGEGHQALLQW